MRQRQPAICLRTTDYSETSQVVVFFTRGSGVVHLLAKGTKRPKSKSGGAIDLLVEGDLVFSTSSRDALGLLMEFTETVSHSALRKEAGRLNAALYMLEAVSEMLAVADPHVEVFDLLHNVLVRLGQRGAPVQAVLAYFQWRLLRHVGLLGEMNACVSCGAGIRDAPASARRDVHFSSSQGGLLCGACEGRAAEKYRLDAATLAGLAVVAAAEAGAKVALGDNQAAGVNRLLAYHIGQQVGKPLRMARHAITKRP